MKDSLKQEVFKFRHQGIPYYGVVALFLLMLYTAVSGKVDPAIISMGFGAGQWIVIILITVASTFVAMEYKNNTIVTLFFKHSRKLNIYLAKFIVVVVYGFILTIFGIVFTFLMKQVLVGNKYHWFSISLRHETLLNSLLLNTSGALVYLLFIAALAFFLITLIRVNAAVIGIGLAIGFLGLDISSAFITAFPVLTMITKWNPLNMISVMGQLADSSYIRFSLLSSSQLICGNLIYTVIFLISGYFLFKKKHV
ncbi:MAG TPA: ABC transporter permease [Ligilactobacillus acidipiscis]|uniref:ABC transporter permease n=1 Tax=Ligilactobacillus acidipiscis TaxID=89059 RepID=A0A921FAW9_9LACO|nr:ABC transporter permease [Ligilactobacillus acidipiscis]